MAAIHGTDPEGEPRLPHTGPRSLLRRVRLDDHLPVDKRLARFYRITAGLMGAALFVFGVLGLTVGGAGDATVAGLSTNAPLDWLSIGVGALLFAGMFLDGNTASTLNLTLGVLFVLSGFVNLVVLERTANILNFQLQNVIFSFVVGVLLMTFGMYGRVSGRLPHDNPYWRARNPQGVARERAGLTARPEDEARTQPPQRDPRRSPERHPERRQERQPEHRSDQRPEHRPEHRPERRRRRLRGTRRGSAPRP
ncbi:DUF4383 domain-containing protein [Streptomyces radicis]|uniref:DUF4383 domain-containing protein n=1 Tax=Streptomyces radicis TaxID=1750517 RepID=A0A3A9WW92_9ACTN|nr:DUF4383 domain-containing protein [Streptomyces radicis]RKN25872.1 DUF4383 domain-containing protein [Streptomyces radicis]